MSELVFRNYDKKAVRRLLIEIGKERYECALKDAKFTSPPLSLEGFFFEFEIDTGNINLYFRFPMCQPIFVMPTLGFWAVPDKGWEMFRKN